MLYTINQVYNVYGDFVRVQLLHCIYCAVLVYCHYPLLVLLLVTDLKGLQKAFNLLQIICYVTLKCS